MAKKTTKKPRKAPAKRRHPRPEPTKDLAFHVALKRNGPFAVFIVEVTDEGIFTEAVQMPPEMTSGAGSDTAGVLRGIAYALQNSGFDTKRGFEGYGEQYPINAMHVPEDRTFAEQRIEWERLTERVVAEYRRRHGVTLAVGDLGKGQVQREPTDADAAALLEAAESASDDIWREIVRAGKNPGECFAIIQVTHERVKYRLIERTDARRFYAGFALIMRELDLPATPNVLSFIAMDGTRQPGATATGRLIVHNAQRGEA